MFLLRYKLNNFQLHNLIWRLNIGITEKPASESLFFAPTCKIIYHNNGYFKTYNRPPGYKTFFMLNSSEHEIYPTHNVKMPTIVGI